MKRDCGNKEDLPNKHSSIVVDDLEAYSVGKNAAVVHLYANHSRHSEQTVAAYLASIARQLVLKRPILMETVEQHFPDLETAIQTTEQLSTLLTEMIPSFEKVFLIIDALDEFSPDRNIRLVLVMALMKIKGNPEKLAFNVFLTSREAGDIEAKLSPTEMIAIRPSDEDITSFVNKRIDCSDTLRK